MKNVCKILSLALAVGLLGGCAFTGSVPVAVGSSAESSSAVESGSASDLPQTSSLPRPSSAEVSSEEERKPETLAALLNALQRTGAAKPAREQAQRFADSGSGLPPCPVHTGH